MLHLRDARLLRAVLLLFGALFCALAFLWLAGGALPAQAEGYAGQAGDIQPGPDGPDLPHQDPAGSAPLGQARAQKKTIYWGALISGSTYGRGNPPWDEGAIDQFEQNAALGHEHDLGALLAGHPNRGADPRDQGALRGQFAAIDPGRVARDVSHFDPLVDHGQDFERHLPRRDPDLAGLHRRRVV